MSTINGDQPRGTRRHLWVRARSQRQWQSVVDGDRARRLATVDAHRHLRGPYTAAGTLVRHLVPQALERCPALVARHDIEVLSVAPELRGVVECTRETLTSLADPEERTRFYPPARTTRLAHGLVELIGELVVATGQVGRSLVVVNADHADPTDAELFTILLRRMDPTVLQVVACTGQGDLWPGLGAALSKHADTSVPADPGPATETSTEASTGDVRAAAMRYVAGDCTADDPRLLGAYDALSPSQRAALHDARADELEARGEVTLRLGAIPLHRERGSDPTGAGARALEHALEHSVLHGYYEAVIDLGRRCLPLLDWDREPERCWLVTAKLATAFSVLDRPDDAATAYDHACAQTSLPSVHLQSAYGRAMLYTRFFSSERRDHAKAKAWINTAIAIASLYPERERRAYNLTFQENGLALVEMHLGDLRAALRLVTEGLQRLEEELPPGKETLHRSVLRYNRAQLLARLGPLEEALEAYNEVIAVDPNHSEYWFERAGVLRRLGRFDEARMDYDEAIRLSPPYPEPHYNRADLSLEMGDVDAALADLSYVLELDPSFADAYVNRSSILYDRGDLEGAAADVETGLVVDPGNAHLHCMRGLIALDRGVPDEARQAFDTALTLDAGLVSAWSNRAVLHFESGDFEAALADLTRAIELDPDPTLRANRGCVHQEAGRWEAAIADFSAALDSGADSGADRPELLYRRGVCRLRSGHTDLARRDFEECVAIADPDFSGLAHQHLTVAVA